MPSTLPPIARGTLKPDGNGIGKIKVGVLINEQTQAQIYLKHLVRFVPIFRVGTVVDHCPGQRL